MPGRPLQTTSLCSMQQQGVVGNLVAWTCMPQCVCQSARTCEQTKRLCSWNVICSGSLPSAKVACDSVMGAAPGRPTSLHTRRRHALLPIYSCEAMLCTCLVGDNGRGVEGMHAPDERFCRNAVWNTRCTCARCRHQHGLGGQRSMHVQELRTLMRLFILSGASAPLLAGKARCK